MNKRKTEFLARNSDPYIHELLTKNAHIEYDGTPIVKFVIWSNTVGLTYHELKNRPGVKEITLLDAKQGKPHGVISLNAYTQKGNWTEDKLWIYDDTDLKFFLTWFEETHGIKVEVTEEKN